MKHASDAPIRKRVGIAATILVALHILLSLIFMLTPESAQPFSLANRMYKQFVLIGPFFDESRIKTSPHLFVRTFEKGQWTAARDFASENQAYYRRHPWRFDKLRLNYFERYITKRVGLPNIPFQLDKVRESGSFRELNQFVLQEYIRRPTDSVSLVYGMSQYFPESGSTRFDTTFAYTYNPAEIGPARTSY